MKKLRPLALVRYTRQAQLFRMEKSGGTPGTTVFDQFVFIGEIPNMPEHGVFTRISNGETFVGLRMDQFEEI